MTTPKMRMSTQDLAERLDQHPGLRARLEAMLSVVEDEAGDCRLADDAEERLVEEMRRIGQAALQGWAQRQVERAEQKMGQDGQVHREGKKNCAGTPALAISR